MAETVEISDCTKIVVVSEHDQYEGYHESTQLTIRTNEEFIGSVFISDKEKVIELIAALARSL